MYIAPQSHGHWYQDKADRIKIASACAKALFPINPHISMGAERLVNCLLSLWQTTYYFTLIYSVFILLLMDFSWIFQ